MGYDMTWNEVPEEITLAVDEAREKYYSLSATKSSGGTTVAVDQEVIDDAYQAMRDAQRDYFRLNIWGMSICRGLMFDFDMTYESDATTSPSYDEDHYLDDPALSSGVQDRPGIAIHKLCSNDGWLVTPVECIGAISQWRKWCQENGHPYDFVPSITETNSQTNEEETRQIEWWQDWLRYLAEAADHGGFRVW